MIPGVCVTWSLSHHTRSPIASAKFNLTANHPFKRHQCGTPSEGTQMTRTQINCRSIRGPRGEERRAEPGKEKLRQSESDMKNWQWKLCQLKSSACECGPTYTATNCVRHYRKFMQEMICETFVLTELLLFFTRRIYTLTVNIVSDLAQIQATSTCGIHEDQMWAGSGADTLFLSGI